MVPYNKVINGITRYIEDEILNKIPGLKKWAAFIVIDSILNNATNVFNQFKTSKIVEYMNIVNERDEIDVEQLYKSLKKQAQKGAVTFDIPMFGALTLNEQDVDKLYSKIMGG